MSVQQKDATNAVFKALSFSATYNAETVEVQGIALVNQATGAPLVLSGVPDNTAPGLPVRPIGQDIWTYSAAAVLASTIDAAFFAQLGYGTGVSVSQSAGNLNIVAGTTINAEYLARSAVAWRGAWIMRYKFIASQRIANNNFAIMLADKIGDGLAYTINSATSVSVTLPAHGYTAANVGQFMCLGGITGAAGIPGRYAIASIPDANTINFTVAGFPASGTGSLCLFGHSYVRNLYTSTTVTNSAFDTQRKGWANGDTTATINTTASPGHLAQFTNDGRSVFLDDQLVATSTTPNVSTRAAKFENIPDDNLDLYVYLWSYNGTTAPASSTTWTVGFVSMEKFANQPVFLAGVKAQGTRPGIPVTVLGSQTIASITAGTNAIGDMGIQYRASATGAATIKHIVSAAGTNATNTKASAGRVVGWMFTNTTAAVKFVKLHNTAGTPTAGASIAMTIAIPANGVAFMSLPGGIGFATGIGYTITGASADTDTTAVAAGDVVGDLFYA